MSELQEYTSTDIKWIKSVTRDKGNSWAYMEYNVGDTFLLNFSKNPKWYPTNYIKAKPKEIIAIFQTLLPTKNLEGGWYLTHLVSPIDENLDKIDNSSHPYVRMVACIAKNLKPIFINPNEWSFFKCNRGQICNIHTIERRYNPDFTTLQKQHFIWDSFNNKEPSLINNFTNLSTVLNDIDEEGVEEGKERTILRLHKFKERNPEIILKAKQKAKNENKLFCEVCLFNFEKQYPMIGVGFIECHHKQHISTGGIRKTKIEDLAIVCSNCHRMLHKKNENGDYLDIETLKNIITTKMG